MASFFSNLINYWANGESADDAQAQADETDRRLRAEIARDADRLGPEVTAESLRHLDENPIDYEREIGDGFEDGLKEGSRTVTGFFRGVFDFTGEAFSAVLRGVPLWLWLVVAAGIFFYFGGGQWLKRRFFKTS
jgi:hypothetical protein